MFKPALYKLANVDESSYVKNEANFIDQSRSGSFASRQNDTSELNAEELERLRSLDLKLDLR